MRRGLLPLAALAVATPVLAQTTTQEDRDRGFLTALIEDNLKAPGLSVRIDGFEGALSSRATLDRLTVSDDAGPWLRLEEVALSWDRAALLRGRLEVASLTADVIQLDRAPLPPEGLTLPEAGAGGGFRIPDIPVSIEIGQVAANRITVGAPILGQDLSFTLEASASLIDGAANLALDATRVDGPQGEFRAAIAFDKESEALEIDLTVSEGAEGIAAGILGLPGQPALDLTAQGSGSLADFSADLALTSDGAERLGGAVTLGRDGPDQIFSLDLSGDVTPLLAPRYRAFFGPQTRMALAGQQGAEGLRLDRLDITTEALQIAGEAVLDPEGWPTLLDVTGRLAAEDGTPVQLPLNDTVTVRRADLRLRHDARESDAFDLSLTALEFQHPAATVDLLSLRGMGEVDREGSSVVAADGQVTATLQGLAATDPALAEALGPEAQFETGVQWSDGAPIEFRDLTLTARDMVLDGQATLNASSETALPLTLDLRAELARLANLRTLFGLDGLAGVARARLQGGLAPLSGAFDMDLEAATRDLRVGQPQVDALVAGASDLSMRAQRDGTGTFLEDLSLRNDAATITGRARILAEGAPQRAQGQTGNATLRVAIADGAGIDPHLTGPISFDLDLGEDGDGAWTGSADFAAPQDVTASLSGRFTGPIPDLSFRADLPRLAAFVDGVPGALVAEGRAFAQNGIWSVESRLRGPWDSTAEVAGPVAGAPPDLTIAARLPDITAPVPALASLEPLQGGAALEGRVMQQGGAWVLDLTGALPSDITARLRGPVTGPAPRLALAATLPDLGQFAPILPGLLSIEADLAQEAGVWRASARAAGPFNTRATAETVLDAGPLSAEFTLDVPRVAAILSGVPGGLNLRGTATQGADGLAVSATGTGPYNADLNAQVTLPEAGPTVAATARLPNAAALAPGLPGPLNLTLDARQRLGRWQAQVDADGPLGLRGQASGVVAGAPLDVQLALTLPDIAAVVPDISGGVRLAGRVTQPGQSYAVDLDVAGPSGAAADVTGTLAPNGQADLTISGSAPLGLANRALAPRRLAGQAAFDLRLQGPPTLNALSGTIRTTGAELSLPTLRNGLDALTATVDLANGRAQVDAQAGLRSGGQVRVSGPVALTAPFDGDLQLAFGITLADPNLYQADLSGALRLTGPLTGGARLAGDVTVDSAEISVPSSGLTAIGDLPPITHLNTPRPVQRTLARAGQGHTATSDARTGPAAEYTLDLRVNAPNRIFVRGRGLDAELGGGLVLSGSTANPITTGGFELVRGRLDILQQRFDFDEGEITFQGTPLPFLRLVAVTETDTLTASIIVEGPADDISVRFTSNPEVPQEEILAQIFFGRDLSQLSPVQALQLANSVAVLAGRSSGGVLERLRGSTGLDDLDVTTDENGGAAVRAGKYISDNVYTDVEINQDGDATVSLNLDITPNLTVRGSTGGSGESSLGLFFQKDY